MIGAGVAQSVSRLAMGWTTEESELESRDGQECSLPHIFQAGSGVHSPSDPKGTGGSFPGVKSPGE
jgi:hypothetical protein